MYYKDAVDIPSPEHLEPQDNGTWCVYPQGNQGNSQKIIQLTPFKLSLCLALVAWYDYAASSLTHASATMASYEER